MRSRARCSAVPGLASIPIVAVTSYAMAGDREQRLAAGCDGYLEKPIDPDSFVADVERFLPAHDVCPGAHRRRHTTPTSTCCDRCSKAHGYAVERAGNGAEALVQGPACSRPT